MGLQVGQLPISNAFVGQLPVSKMFVGEEQVYPADAPIGDASEYTIFHKKASYTDGYLPTTLDGSPYKVSREVDADGNRVWMDGVPGSKYDLRTDTILIDAPKGSGLTFASYRSGATPYDWVDDLECLGHDELGDLASFCRVDRGTNRTTWSCLSRPITLTSTEERPSMEWFMSCSSNTYRGYVPDLSTFTKNLTGQKWGRANLAFAYNDVEEQDLARWIGGWNNGYVYELGNKEANWGNFGDAWGVGIESNPLPNNPDIDKCAWPTYNLWETDVFEDLGEWDYTTQYSSSKINEGEGNIRLSSSLYIRLHQINANGEDVSSVLGNLTTNDALSIKMSNGRGCVGVVGPKAADTYGIFYWSISSTKLFLGASTGKMRVRVLRGVK